MKIVEGNTTTDGAGGLVEDRPIDRAKRIAVGLCFIVFPLIWVFAFAVHPDLADPRILTAEELIARAHGDGLQQAAHALVTLNTAVLVVLTVHFMKLLDHTSGAWAGLVGAAMAVLGACLLAADKGALCLTMSALDTLPESEFAQMMPGLLAMFSFKGWMVLVWGLLLMPIGVAIQTVAMLKTKVLPRWQLWLLLVGVLFVGFPDGAEIINLSAAVLMAVALIPYGAQLVSRRSEHVGSPPVDRDPVAVLESKGEERHGASRAHHGENQTSETWRGCTSHPADACHHVVADRGNRRTRGPLVDPAQSAKRRIAVQRRPARLEELTQTTQEAAATCRHRLCRAEEETENIHPPVRR